MSQQKKYALQIKRLQVIILFLREHYQHCYETKFIEIDIPMFGTYNNCFYNKN